MIRETAGDILLSKAQAIAHGIAPNDHFDNDLALALRERWPAMAKDFRHYAHGAHPKPGSLWVWGGTGGLRVFNLLLQAPAPESERIHRGLNALHRVIATIEDDVLIVADYGARIGRMLGM